MAVAALEVLVELIFGAEAFAAAGNRAWEESSFSVPLNVSFELRLIVEERRAQVARIFTARGDLRFDSDAVRS